MRLKVLGLSILLSLSTFASASTWELDHSHSRIGFSINHLGYSNSHGVFTAYEGQVNYDKAKPENTNMEFVINTDSISTASKDLNEHLQTSDFFNVTKHPTMTFKSNSLTMEGAEKAKIKGKLTLLGVSRPVVLDVVLHKHDVSPMTKLDTIGFSATTTIKRSAWGMNIMIPAISDDVKISIDGELNIVE